MAMVAGVDFGTLSVRVSLVDSERGLLESAVAEYRCIASAKIRNMPPIPWTITCERWLPPPARS